MAMLRSIQGMSCRLQKLKFYSEMNVMSRELLRRYLSVSSVAGRRTADLVIFDKDGTLIDFSATWAPWVKQMARNLSSASRHDVKDAVYDAMGFCEKTETWKIGAILGTNAQIQQRFIHILQGIGYSHQEATHITDENMFFPDLTEVTPIDEPLDIFRTLKSCDVKVAVCTSDSRQPTLQSLASLKVDQLTDRILCGDDKDFKPKPDPHNIWLVCNDMGVDVRRTVMVGDSSHDVDMGVAAGVGLNIGVLSGVGQRTEMVDGADVIVSSIKHILSLVLPHLNSQ